MPSHHRGRGAQYDALLIVLKDLVEDVKWFAADMYDREPPHMLDSFARAEAAIARAEDGCRAGLVETMTDDNAAGGVRPETAPSGEPRVITCQTCDGLGVVKAAKADPVSPPETAPSAIRENVEKLSRPIDRLRALVLACEKIAPKMRAEKKPNVAEMFDVAREIFQEGVELLATADPVSPTRIAPDSKLQRRLELAERAYDRLNLCPDHRDKTNGRCVVCVAEERTRQEAAAIRALRGAS